ncbi:MAG: hypothetical protein V1728_03900 [Candidatus Micrarchaeota archaeon]
MTVNFWSTESRLYAEIDAAGKRGRYDYKKTINIGDVCSLDFKVNDLTKTPLENSRVVDPEKFVVSLNFRNLTSPLGPHAC